MEFELHFKQPQTREVMRRGGDSPMRMLVMADFSGRANRGAENAADLAERPIVGVDVDNFEDVLFRFAPQLYLPIGDPAGPSMIVEFKVLDDFHPDRLFRRLEIFDALRKTRSRLSDSATFTQAAAELRYDAERRPSETPDNAPNKEILQEEKSEMFERLLGRGPVTSPEARVKQPAGRVDVQGLIKNIVAPYIVPEQDPQQAQYVASVDTAISDHMRQLLHHGAFQGLEGIWTGLSRLLSTLETDETLQVHLLDVTREELVADFQGAQGDLERSGLYRQLVEQGINTLGGEPWSVLVGHYTFGSSGADTALLAAMGTVASAAGGAFLAAAGSDLLGCRSLAELPDPSAWTPMERKAARRWEALRRSALAPWIGLTLPRVLLRLPYGTGTDEIDEFAFEELTTERAHADYLWGNPAVHCAHLIGQSYRARGWQMEPGDHLEVCDLPTHVYEEDGERKLQACAETYLGERAAMAILDRGLMPMVSYKNRNAVRLLRFQSIADPPASLAGPWA